MSFSNWRRFFGPVLGLSLAAGLWWQLSRATEEFVPAKQTETSAPVEARPPDKKDAGAPATPERTPAEQAAIDVYQAAWADFLKSDPRARRAEMTLELYVVWNKGAGAARGEKVEAVQHFQRKKGQCVAYSRLLKLEEMAEMLRDPDYGPMLLQALRNDQARNAQGWSYHEFGFQPYLPPEMLEPFLKDPASVIEQMRPSAGGEELEEDFRDWYRDAIRADLFYGVSYAYLRPKINELRAQFFKAKK